MANDGTTWDRSLANIQVNEATDTVYGQLKKHTNFTSPVMQRVAQTAKDSAAARGLGNTTISQGAATGAVIDKAGEFAARDAEIYSNRKNENQRAGTHLTSTAMGNQTTLVSGRERNANNLSVQALSNQGALAVEGVRGHNAAIIAAADRTSREGIASGDREATNTRLAMQNASTERVAEGDRTSREDTALDERTSRETIASQDAATRIQMSELDSNTKMEVVRMQQETERLRQNNSATQGAWDNFQNGVAQIDPNASRESQQAQYTRLKDNFTARMEFNSGLFGANGNPHAAVIDGSSLNQQALDYEAELQLMEDASNYQGF